MLLVFGFGHDPPVCLLELDGHGLRIPIENRFAIGSAHEADRAVACGVLCQVRFSVPTPAASGAMVRPCPSDGVPHRAAAGGVDCSEREASIYIGAGTVAAQRCPARCLGRCIAGTFGSDHLTMACSGEDHPCMRDQIGARILSAWGRDYRPRTRFASFAGRQVRCDGRECRTMNGRAALTCRAQTVRSLREYAPG